MRGSCDFTVEACDNSDKPYFLQNEEWYVAPGFDPDMLERPGYTPTRFDFKLTDMAPEEAVASYNHCFNISPDGKDIIPYFMTDRSWFGVHRSRVEAGEGRVFFLKDAAPPEAVWSFWSYYEGYGDEHVIPYFMLDESWYERDEAGRLRLTGRAPYLAKASFVDYMHPCFIDR